MRGECIAHLLHVIVLSLPKFGYRAAPIVGHYQRAANVGVLGRLDGSDLVEGLRVRVRVRVRGRVRVRVRRVLVCLHASSGVTS